MCNFGNPTIPFGRCAIPLPPYKTLQSYHCIREDFNGLIHNGEFNGLPEYPEELKVVPPEHLEELLEFGKIISDSELKRNCCYLWIINTQKIIEIIWEGTPNEKDPLGFVKHSNISGGTEAFHGGEMYFGAEGTIYINNASDRYGFSGDLWPEIVKHFSKIYHKYKIVSINK